MKPQPEEERVRLDGTMTVYPALVSCIERTRKKRLPDRRRTLESIRDLPWRRFETLVAGAFAGEGFTVTENACAGADGGVDIRRRRAGDARW